MAVSMQKFILECRRNPPTVLFLVDDRTSANTLEYLSMQASVPGTRMAVFGDFIEHTDPEAYNVVEYSERRAADFITLVHVTKGYYFPDSERVSQAIIGCAMVVPQGTAVVAVSNDKRVDAFAETFQKIIGADLAVIREEGGAVVDPRRSAGVL